MMNQDLDGWGGRIRSGGTAVWMHGDQDYVSFPLYHKESDPEASQKAISVWKNIVELSMQRGASFLVLNKNIGDLCAGYFPSEYHNFLRTIKKAIDPNSIMNPYLLGLSEEE